jgi:hypothetical protein
MHTWSAHKCKTSVGSCVYKSITEWETRQKKSPCTEKRATALRVYCLIFANFLVFLINLFATPAADSAPPLVDASGSVMELAENVPLMLPSSLLEDKWVAGCTPQLIDIEWQLREAECQSSLDQIRTQLHIKSCLCIYKEQNVRYQGPNTHARGLLDHNDTKIRFQQDKYCAARWALISLPGGAKAAKRWNRLYDSELRCMEEKDMTLQEKEKEER